MGDEHWKFRIKGSGWWSKLRDINWGLMSILNSIAFTQTKTPNLRSSCQSRSGLVHGFNDAVNLLSLYFTTRYYSNCNDNLVNICTSLTGHHFWAAFSTSFFPIPLPIISLISWHPVHTWNILSIVSLTSLNLLTFCSKESSLARMHVVCLVIEISQFYGW